MNKLIKKEVDEIKNLIPETNMLSDDFVFGMIAYKYFYNEGKFDKLDFKDSYTDGINDGGIDLIAIEENDLDKNLILLQSKNIQGVHSKDEIKDIFIKMAQTVSDFKTEKIGSYNEKLRRVFREKFDYAADDANFSIKFALFLGFDKDDQYRNMIYDHLEKVDILKDFECLIYFERELIQQIQYFEEERTFVPNGKIKIFKDQGLIKNGENGILVNISANSLRNLYDRYKNEGLFEQNFRYFVKNDKIDSQIEDSLKNRRDKFWFLNNGIIIGCKNFVTDGDNVKLEDFSIINGCQTTTIIGTYKGPNQDLDFPIPCKIIKPELEGEDYLNSFITQIAEASNSQKPISDRDLKSNQIEQRQLQNILKQDNPKVYLEIKRGEGILKKKGIEPWQKIRNDQFGQLILAGLLQQPGTARSAKKKIFSDKYTYNRIFKRTQDKNTIVDLLRLSDFYDKYLISAKLSEKASNVSKNGKYCIIGIICFLIKHSRGYVDLKQDTNSNEWSSDLVLDNLLNNFFSPSRPDDFEKILNSIFNQIIQSLASLYTSRESLETSVTNFFKTDKKYHSVILDRIVSELISDPYEWDKFNEKFSKVFC